nr:hypothetical protein [Pandoravirus belohorizontensis]
MWVHPRTGSRAPIRPTTAVATAWPGERCAKPPRPLARTVPAAIREIDRSGSGDSDNSGNVIKDARRTGPMRGQSNATATRAGTQRADSTRRVKGPIAHMVALSGPDANVRARYHRQPPAVARATGDRPQPGPSRQIPPRLSVPPRAERNIGNDNNGRVTARQSDSGGGGGDDASTSRSDSRESESDADADDDDDGYEEDEDDVDERTGVTDWGGLQEAALMRARADATREQRRTAHALAHGLVGLRSAMERAWLRSALVPPAAVAEVEARAQAFLRAGCCCAWEPAVAPLGASLRALVAQLGIDRPQEPTPCFVALLDALIAAVRLVVASDPDDLGRAPVEIDAPPTVAKAVRSPAYQDDPSATTGRAEVESGLVRKEESSDAPRDRGAVSVTDKEAAAEDDDRGGRGVKDEGHAHHADADLCGRKEDANRHDIDEGAAH